MRWLRTVWFVLTLRCEEADRLRLIRSSKTLSRTEHIAERTHRALCAGCRRAARELDRMDRGLEHIANISTHTVSADPADEAWSDARRERLERAVRSASEKN